MMQSNINVWKLPNASQIMNILRNEGAIIFEEGSAGSVSKLDREQRHLCCNGQNKRLQQLKPSGLTYH